MPLRAHGPEPCASANFATRADLARLAQLEPPQYALARSANHSNSVLEEGATNIYLVVGAVIGSTVGLLDSFEKGLERAVNGAFARTFKSGLQPIEITASLRRELDTKAAVVSRDRILVPNSFTVQLAPGDFAAMTAIGPTLIEELGRLVRQHAAAQHYQFAGAVSIQFAEDATLRDGVLHIDSVNVKGTVSWEPVVDIAGKRYPILKSRTIIGRGSEADITVDDSGISRKHVEILWNGSRAEVNDLGSTNGSQLNGAPVSKAPLPTDSVITIGRTRIVFRVLAQSSTVDPFLGLLAGDDGGRGAV